MSPKEGELGGQGHVQLTRVSVGYSGRRVVNEISLEMPPGEFICLLGPSGCGKTTLLRAVAGLVTIEEGSILIDGTETRGLPAHQRGIAMVFQDLALFPHMTVYENIAFGLRLKHLDRRAIDAEISSILMLLHLKELRDRLPRQLSGGQQQRVAIARSLVVRPSVLLLDEPFAALDRKLREELRREIRTLQRRLGITIVFVTHDQEEALTLSDRVAVMNAGRLEQIGSSAEIYEWPASRFVMNFVGSTNFLRVADLEHYDKETRCKLAGQLVSFSTTRIPEKHPDKRYELAIRPERIRILDEVSPPMANRISGVISDATYEGASVIYEVELADKQRLLVRQQNAGGQQQPGHTQLGKPVVLGWSVEDAIIFAALCEQTQSR